MLFLLITKYLENTLKNDYGILCPSSKSSKNSCRWTLISKWILIVWLILCLRMLKMHVSDYELKFLAGMYMWDKTDIWDWNKVVKHNKNKQKTNNEQMVPLELFCAQAEQMPCFVLSRLHDSQTYKKNHLLKDWMLGNYDNGNKNRKEKKTNKKVE